METPEPEVAPVIVAALLVCVQAKVVPATGELKAMAIGLPVQIVLAAGVAVATGLGLTVTGTLVLAGPTQPEASAST